jgi:membrane fusion protein, macrolide-specific efflux system
VEYRNIKLVGEVVANPTTMYNDPNEAVRRTALIRIPKGLPADTRIGDDARIIYEQEKRENVLVLERNLINLMSGRRYVNVLQDGVRVEKDVEVGLQTDTEAEIVKGLAEGELVITN